MVAAFLPLHLISKLHNNFFTTVNTFDPSKNVQLKTKVFADMQKVSRLNMKYQNLGRIPGN